MGDGHRATEGVANAAAAKSTFWHDRTLNRECVVLVLHVETGDVRMERALLGDERNTTVCCGNEAGKRFAQIWSAWLVDIRRERRDSCQVKTKNHKETILF